MPALSGFSLHLRRAVIGVLAAGLFVFDWLYRFNDPNGSFAGLTDDHFFYLVRGWQLLFGDLPVRDFVDHGAPLYYYVGAAVQLVVGRGTLSELLFSVTVLAACASATFWLAARASGSIAAGLVAAAFQIFLEPRFYNYPKLLVYVVAIPLLWRFAEKPTAALRFWLALVTAVGFLFRHDHGVFVAVAMAVLLLLMERQRWLDRLKHAVIYGALVGALLAPYLMFVQLNGGVVSYFEQAAAWADRDRDRAPVVWPGLFENPDGVSDEAQSPNVVTRGVAVVRDNITAWTFYAEIALPIVALLLLVLSPVAFRPAWPQARAKIGMVAVLALVLDAGFLRSPLEARLADPSVPLAILLAWSLVALVRVSFVTSDLQPSFRGAALLARAAALAVTVPLLFVFGAGMTHNLYDRLDESALTDRFGKGFERAPAVAEQVRKDWTLESWLDRPDRPALYDLAFYVNACTLPGDRVMVQAYIPQVLALARRAFAGGHADLRPGFFTSTPAQELTVSRLQRQSVPVVLLEAGKPLENFREAFPIITAYLDKTYRVAGTKEFDGRFGTTLLVRRDRQPTGTYAPFGWPCYGAGVVRS
jgi:4-amino-4-deoxy-L-arabinose transferase-like glycosyltransferase